MGQILKSKAFHSGLGLLISAVLIVWVFSKADWSLVLQRLGHMRFEMFLPVLLITILHYYFRAWRWRYLLAEGNKVRIQRLFDAIIVGNFASFILPLRAGEFVKPFLVSRYGSLSFSTCFVSVIVERFFDLSVVLISFALVAGHVSGMPEWVGQGAQALLVLAFLILALMVVSSFMPKPVLRLADTFFGFLPKALSGKLRKFTADFISGAAILNHGSRLFMVVALSVCVWMSCYIQFDMFFWLFDESPGLWPAVTIAVIVALAVAAPSAPGFIGVYQAGCVAGFVLFGLDKDLAVAYSIVTHLFQYVIFVVYGVYVLMRDDLRLGQLLADAKGQERAA